MATKERKVNKPRLTLRKDKPKELTGLQESVITLFFALRYDVDSFVDKNPKDIMLLFGELTARDAHKKLTGMTRRYLRSYIAQYKLRDWTR